MPSVKEYSEGLGLWSGNHMTMRVPTCKVCGCREPEAFAGLCERHLDEKLEQAEDK